MHSRTPPAQHRILCQTVPYRGLLGQICEFRGHRWRNLTSQIRTLTSRLDILKCLAAKLLRPTIFNEPSPCIDRWPLQKVLFLLRSCPMISLNGIMVLIARTETLHDGTVLFHPAHWRVPIEDVHSRHHWAAKLASGSAFRWPANSLPKLLYRTTDAVHAVEILREPNRPSKNTQKVSFTYWNNRTDRKELIILRQKRYEDRLVSTTFWYSLIVK